MSLDTRHLDIECALGEKSSAESAIGAADARAVVRVEKPSVGAKARVTATKKPTSDREDKVGVIAAPGLRGA